MLLLIPLLPFVGFLLNASFGKRLAKGVSGAIACAVMIASFVVSVVSVWRLVALPPEARADGSRNMHAFPIYEIVGVVLRVVPALSTRFDGALVVLRAVPLAVLRSVTS